MKNMEMDQKLRLLNGKNFWVTHGNPEYGIREIVFSDGPSGLRYQPGENDHLGLNESCKATCFPTPAALSCSWDPALVREVSSCIAQEAAEKGVDVVLAPGVNMKRSPLCGRNFEYFSEDPYLSKELGVAYIKGLQENGIGSSLKHFAANNQEAYRLSIDTLIDERALNEIYLKAFKEIIQEADPWTVMSAYNKLLGEYCSENKWLLTDLLRDEWGYDGLVISDWYAVNDIVKSINSGLNLEMPSVGECSYHLLQEGYRTGELDGKAVDRAVNNLIQLMRKCDNPIKKPGKADYSSHHEIAHRAAAESFVLLKNDKNTLPLKPADQILCVGELMQRPVIQGNGSSRVNAMEIDSIPVELTKAGIQYRFEPGYRLNTEETDKVLADRAIQAASVSDKIIFFSGLFNDTEAESYDRENLCLPQCQNDLVDRLSKLGKELIIVLQTGSAAEMPWIGGVETVLQMHLSGQGAGKALADVLTGKTNPSGKLTETYPLKLSHTPSWLSGGNTNRVEYRESIFTGYRYYDKKELNVLFPFGHGLSYTEFSYDSLKVERLADHFLVSFKVTNTGTYEGKEIAQLYIGLNENAAIQPVRRLAAFRKILLKPGEAVVVELTIPFREFMYYDVDQKEFVYATGWNTIEVGKSSRRIELMEMVELTVSNKKYAKIHANTTLGELQSIPELNEIIAAWLSAILQQVGLHESEIVNVKELERSMFYMPLRNAVQISNGEFSFDDLNSFIETLNKKLEEIT